MADIPLFIRMDRFVFHIDANSAFLSWSAAYRVHVLGEKTDLRDIPSIVGGDQEKRHGIVLAKSVPAKKYGIQTGEAVMTARQKCPELVIVPPDYGLYVNASRAFMEILRKYTDKVIQYSIDEAWGVFDGYEKVYGKGREVELALKIKKEIYKELGFTVNIGISNNFLLSKMAGDLSKPDKVHTLFPEEIEKKMWPLPVSDLFFVGRATTRKLLNLGIKTIGDLAECPVEILTRKLGKMGAILHMFANGRDISPVQRTDHVPNIKSVGNSATTPRDLICDDDVHLMLFLLTESVASRMRELVSRCTVVEVYIRDTELNSFCRQRKLQTPTCSSSEIANVAFDLFRKNYHWDKPVRSIGVRGSGLVTADAGVQLSFYADAIKRDKRERIDAAVDELRERYGYMSVRRALTLADPLLGAINPKDDHTVHPVGYFGG